MRRYTIAELEAMEAAELLALLDLFASVPKERHGEMFACSVDEINQMAAQKDEQREALKLNAAVLDSGSKA